MTYKNTNVGNNRIFLMFTTNRYGMIDKVSYIMQKKTHFQTDDTHSDVTELMDPWVHIS